MSTAPTETPGQAQVLTSIDPNSVSMHQAPLPTVHNQSIKHGGSSGTVPVSEAVQTTEKDKPAITNSKKRKSDSGDALNAADGDKDSGKAKKPRTSRSKKSDEGSTKASSKKAQAEALFDVSSIHLDGEEAQHTPVWQSVPDVPRIPVYETCDSIRRMIRDALKKDGVTQAGFCRALAQATPVLNKPPQGVQLSRFMNSKGVLSGNTNVVFYASYVLFEKMRIRDGKPKSKFRQEMEEKHGPKGVDTRDSMDLQYFTVHVTEKIWFDKYGKLQVTKI